jgi:DNA-binding XRE family transcriptional regulator
MKRIVATGAQTIVSDLRYRTRMLADDAHGREVQFLLDRFGARIKELRHGKDISQQELADRCGLHRTEISLLERGLRAPRLPTVLLLAQELEVPIEGPLLGHMPVPNPRAKVEAAADDDDDYN